MAFPLTDLTRDELRAAIIRDPLTVTSQTPVLEAISRMWGVKSYCELFPLSDQPKLSASQDFADIIHHDARFNCVVVIEEAQVIGILTERDIVRLTAQQKNLSSLVVGQVMTRPVVTLSESAFTDIFQAITRLQQYRIRHLPILDDRGRLVGIVTHESLRIIARPIDLLRLMQAKSVMTHNVIQAGSHSSMMGVAQLMAQHRVSSVVVVEPWGDQRKTDRVKPIGILTERDIIQFQRLNLSLETLTAREIMSAPLFSVQPDASLMAVQQIMDQHFIRRVVVTDAQGILLGIVTQTSLLQILNPLELYNLVNHLESRVVGLEAEKIAMLKNRTVELEQEVEARTQALQTKVEQEKIFSELTNQIRSSLSLQTILDTTVSQVRRVLGCDRVNIWRVEANWQTVAIAEATMAPDSLMGKCIQDTCFNQALADIYRQGHVRVVPDIYAANLTDCHRDMLESLQTRAKILVPIYCGNKLWGLLNATESKHARDWKTEEINLLRALSEQLTVALQQALTHERLQYELVKREQAEKFLRESEQRYATLVQSSPVGIFHTDEWGQYTFVNERWCEIAGIPSAQAAGQWWHLGIHPDDCPIVKTYWQQTVQDDQPFEQEYRFQRPDGQVSWVKGQIVSIMNAADGQLCGYVGTITDISIQKCAEESLRQSEAKNRAILSAIPDFLFRVNSNGVYQEVVTFQGGISLVPQTLSPIGLSMAELLPPDIARRQMTALTRALQTGSMQTFEQDVLTDNRCRYEEVRVVKINENEGLFLIRDITSRKRTELQLQNLIEGTAKTIGHDFFPALAKHIALALNVDFSIVTEWSEDVLKTLACWGNGTLQPAFSYSPLGTPCARVLREGAYFCDSSLQEKFPEDADLVAMGVNSYLGVGLYDADNNVIGLLCILSQQSIEEPQQAMQILQVFAVRAAAELERQKINVHLEQLNLQLETKVSERTIALQEREARYRALMDGASDAIVLADEKGNVLEANDQAEALLGYTRQELTTMHVTQLHPASELTRVLDVFDGARYKQSNQILDIPFLCKDGGTVPVDVSASSVKIHGEQIIQSIFRDIRNRKAAEKKLTITQAVVDAAVEGVFIIRSDGDFAYINQSACHTLGYNIDELLPLSLFDVDVGFSAETWPDFWETIKQGLPVTLESLHKAKDGSIYPVEESIKYLKLYDEEYSFAFVRDISARKQAEDSLRELSNRLQQTNEELIRATRLKDEFLANMSHELRTPLNAVLGLVEGLQDGVFGEPHTQQIRALKTIEQSGTHLLELINDILDVAKIESGQVKLERVPTNVNILCQSSLNFVKQQAQKKNIQIQTKLPANLPDVLMDERRIRQVLINLLNNAVKFTPDQGTITLSLSVHRGQLTGEGTVAERSHPASTQLCLQFAVIDTGIGIASENIAKLFQPFIQIDSALNRQYSGTGLGLALVKRIVELHGGRIQVSSELGIGSQFRFDLPCDTLSTMPLPAADQQMVETEISFPSIVDPLILLAEDNEINVTTMSSYLQAKGYRLIVATNGREAVDLAISEQPDLILMDIQMPDMDGIEAMQKIRLNNELATVPIIALTALAMPEDRKRCLDAGANDYLTKPVKLKHLVTTMQQLLLSE